MSMLRSLAKGVGTVALVSSLVAGSYFGARSFLSSRVNELWAKRGGIEHTVSNNEISSEIQKWGPWAEPFLDDLSWKYRVGNDKVGLYDPFGHSISVPISMISKGDLFSHMAYRLDAFDSEGKNKGELYDNFMGSDEKLDLDDATLFGLFKTVIYLSNYDSGVDSFVDLGRDGVDHELSHALIDGPAGVMASSGYAGPNSDDLKGLVVHIQSRNDLKEHLAVVNNTYLNGRFDALIAEAGSLESFLSEDLSLDPMSKVFENRLLKGALVPDTYVGVLELAHPDDVFVSVKKTGMFSKLPSKVKDFVFSYDRSSFPLMTVELDNGGSLSQRDYILGSSGLYVQNSSGYNEVYFSPEMHDLVFDHSERDLPAFWSYVDRFARQNTILSETLARSVDSLMSVYVGEPSENYWRLSEPELLFFDSMLLEGKKIFGDAVEKYRVGLQMLDAGAVPEDIQNKLQYSTCFNFGGKEYFWESCDFDISHKLDR